MKKISILILSILILFVISGCDNSIKYPYEHIGIYDTKTQQNIDIGDSKDKVDRILGSCKKDEYNYYNYADNLSIHYNNNNEVDFISTSFYDFSNEYNNERYTLADGTNYKSTVTDFINKYDYVYECEYEHSPYNNVCVLLKNENNKIIQMSPDKIEEIKEFSVNKTYAEMQESYPYDLYRVMIYYSSYNNLEMISIDKIECPAQNYPIPINWNLFKEIDK